MGPRGERKGNVMPTRGSLRIREKKMKLVEKIGKTKPILPQELEIEILRWLPASSLVRFKCVSKSWRALIQDRFLVKMHFGSTKYAWVHQKTNANNGDVHFNFLKSRDGLVLERSKFSSEYRIRNPLTRQVLDLPNPLEKHLYMRLEYSEVAKNYKLLYLYLKGDTESGGCKILTVDRVLEWRNIEVAELQEGINKKTKNAFRDGVLFVFKPDHPQIVCFEIESERATIVENIPQDCIMNAESSSIVHWNDKVAVVNLDHNPVVGLKIDAWVLEDYRKQKWGESKISIFISSITRYIPEVTTISVWYKSCEFLHFYVNSGKHYVAYKISDRDAKPFIKVMPPGEVLLGAHYSSVAYLEGMIPEATHEETSDYRISPRL